MTDIVETLRDAATSGFLAPPAAALCERAAEEIERLRYEAASGGAFIARTIETLKHKAKPTTE